MKKFSLYAACFAAHCALISTSVFAASFDCSRGGSVAEKIICKDAELSALDDQLSKTYKQAKKNSADKRAFATESDKLWKWREQNCRSRECLVDWYHQRQAALETDISNGGKVIAPSLPSLAKAAALPVSAPLPSSALSSAATPAPSPVAPTVALSTPAAMPSKPTAKTAASFAVSSLGTAAVAAINTVTANSDKPPSMLQLKLSSAQIAHIAPDGASPRPHYLSVDKGEYFYADPELVEKGATSPVVSVRYLGIDHGQHIIEAKARGAVMRYTCSADCVLIGKLVLPGDMERDLVIVPNDHRSLPSLIVNDAMNGLLAESVAR
jgi:uncharacterized protein